MFIAVCKNKHQINVVTLFTAVQVAVRYDYQVT